MPSTSQYSPSVPPGDYGARSRASAGSLSQTLEALRPTERGSGADAPRSVGRALLTLERSGRERRGDLAVEP